jgi:hypothetical protein
MEKLSALYHWDWPWFWPFHLAPHHRPNRLVAACWSASSGEANKGFDKNMIPKVEKEKGRPISAQEREKLRGLDEAKKSAVAPIQESFAELIAQQSGLSRRAAMALLLKVGL